MTTPRRQAAGSAMTPPGVMALFSLPAILVIVTFFAIPLGSVIVEAFSDRGGAFARVASDPLFWKGLRGSLLLGTLAPFAATVIGFIVALHLARLKERVRLSILFAISLPLTFSGLIIAYGFILVFGRSGFVTNLAALAGADPAFVGGLIFTQAGLGFAYCYYLIPRVVMVVLPAVLNFDHAQIAAARALGATSLRAHWDIFVPQVLPSLIAAFCLCAAVAIGAYGTALALVGSQINILPMLLYSRISETGTDLPAAAAVSVILIFLCCSIIGIAEMFRRPGAAAPR